MTVTPALMAVPLSLLLGLVLFVVGLFRMRGGWKRGISWIAGAMLLQSWWVLLFLWMMTSPDIGIHQEISIKAEDR